MDENFSKIENQDQYKILNMLYENSWKISEWSIRKMGKEVHLELLDFVDSGLLYEEYDGFNGTNYYELNEQALSKKKILKLLVDWENEVMVM